MLPYGTFLGEGVELCAPGACRGHRTTRELPASDLLRCGLVEEGEDLTPARRRGRNPRPARYLRRSWALSTFVHGPRERNNFFLPVLGWCKPDTRYRALSLEPRVPGPSRGAAQLEAVRGGRTCTRMSTARRASELLLPLVSAAHAAPPTWRPALCSSGGHADQKAVLHGGVRRA